MATFTAEEVFSTVPTVTKVSVIEDIDVGGLHAGDEVYLSEQIFNVIPPVASFDFNGGDNAIIERVDITDYNNAFTETSGMLPIITNEDGAAVVQYSAADDEFLVAFFALDGSIDNWATYSASAGVREAFLEGDVTFSIRMDIAASVADCYINVNSIETFHLGTGRAPRYSAVRSTGFRNLDVTTTTGSISFEDANLEVVEDSTTDLLGRKVLHDGEKLVDVSKPTTIQYGNDITQVYHNQTVLVSSLTEDITLNVDDLATHFRVLYLEDTEVTNSMSLTFPNDTFTLGYASDDVTFTKLSDDSWFYLNKRNNEKGIF